MGLVQAALGIVIMAYLLVSILCALVIMIVPYLTLRFFNEGAFLKLICFLQASYLHNIVFMMENVLGLKLRVTGHAPKAEAALVLANHLTHDWAPMYCMAIRIGTLGFVRTVIKKSMSYIPGFGWGMVVCYWPFVSRSYEKDEKSLKKLFAAYHRNKLPVQLWLYPEGTRQTPKKLKESQDYAKEHGYTVWNHVMLPRHRGFVQALRSLEGVITHIHEVTLSYSGWRRKAPTFWDILTSPGAKEHVMHVHLNRVDVKTVPTDEEGLKNWLRESFDRKEELLEYFAKHERFPGDKNLVQDYSLAKVLPHVVAWVLYTYFVLSFVW